MRKITGVTHILIAAISKPENLHRHAATNRLPECRTSWIMVEGQFHWEWAFSRFFADCVFGVHARCFWHRLGLLFTS